MNSYSGGKESVHFDSAITKFVIGYGHLLTVPMWKTEISFYTPWALFSSSVSTTDAFDFTVLLGTDQMSGA